MKTKNIATIFAILAAALYAINVPVSKIFLNHVEPTMMAAFLYLGAGVGLLIYGLIQKILGKGETQEPLTKKELPYTIAMVVLVHSHEHAHKHSHTHVHESEESSHPHEHEGNSLHGENIEEHEHTHENISYSVRAI